MVLKISIFVILFMYGADGQRHISDKSYEDLFEDAAILKTVPEYVTTSSRWLRDTKQVTTEEILDDKGCGWINDIEKKSQNGSKAVTKYRKLPWQVSIYWVSLKEDGTELEIHDNCAGTLIHPRVVLTQPKYDEVRNLNIVRVKAGDWNLLSTDDFKPQFSAVESVAKIKTRWFGVNLLFLASPIERSAHVNYACLPSPDLVTEVGTDCLLEADHNYMGVAHQKPTKMLEVSSMDLEECRRKIRESQFLWTDVKLNSSWICVSNIAGRQNPCEGTDGTPLVCPYKNSPGRYYHAGVMSWYSSCYFGEGYGIFKTVAHARTLIDKKMIEKGYGTQSYSLK